MFFILGKSGSGKSTLLNILSGLDTADSGNIFFKGENLATFSQSQLENFRNKEIGFVFQDYNLLEDFDVFKNVSLALELQSEKQKSVLEEKVKKSLEAVGLKGYEKRKINELSGGQKQRVSIARAIIKDSSIILADEPTGNLDSETGEEIFAILKELSKEKLVIVVSHDRENAEKYGDGIIRIKDGKTENAIFESEKLDAQTAKADKPIKIPFSYSLGIALKNMGQKKFRVFLTVVSTILLLIFTCGMYVFYDFNSERDIAINSKNNQTEYFELAQINQEYSGKYNTLVTGTFIEDFSGLRYLDGKGINYLKRYNLNGNVDSLQLEYKNDDNSSRIYGSGGNVYLLESEAQLLGMGFELYSSGSGNGQGAYLTDVLILGLLYGGYKIDGYTFQGKNYLDFEHLSGKTISKNGKSYDVLGVIKTDFVDLVEENQMETYPQATLKIKRDLTESENVYFEKVCGKIFMPKQTYLSKYGIKKEDMQHNLVSTGTYNLTISGENTAKVDYVDDIISNCVMITKNGKKICDDVTLEDNEIAISLGLFNQLFPNAQIDESADGFFEREIDYDLSNLDKKLSLSFFQNSLDIDFWGAKDLTIKAIVVEDPPIRLNRVIINPTLLDKINPEWQLYLYCNSVLAFDTDYDGMQKNLTYLRENFDYVVDSNTATMLYQMESVMANLSKVFLVLLVISLICTVLLLINLISFGVSARTKEIGILKALGTGNKELGKSYLIETLIISTFSFIVGLVASSLFVDFANAQVLVDSTLQKGIVWFVQTPISYLLMAVQTFVIMPLLTFVPLRKITKLTPVDAIKK